MGDALATYLHDHLAGSNFAIELLKTLQNQHPNESLGEFAAGLRVQVEEDRRVLQRIADRVGSEGSPIKEVTAWVAEKASQFKLKHSSSGLLGTFQALETLALGILGKLALWRALAIVASIDVRVQGEDYDALIARALSQHSQVDERRLQIAPAAFTNSAPLV